MPSRIRKRKARLWLTCLCAALAPGLRAQGLDYARDDDSFALRVAAEGAFGSGDYTPYYLTANRQGILSTQAGTGYMRAAATWNRDLRHGHLTTVADVQVQADDYSSFYLQQLAVDLSWRYVYLTAGAWELDPMLRHRELSSGATVWSGNARPIPQVQIGTNGFIDIPGTRRWLQAYFDISYGRYTDDGYLGSRHETYMQYWADRGIDKIGTPNSFVTDRLWHHHKQIYFRTDPARAWYVTAGLDHAVQFGGRTQNNPSTDYTDIAYKVRLKDFFKVLKPTSGDDSDNIGDQNFAYGNHIGNLNLMLTRQGAWGDVSFYLENLFEDGSGIAKRNGWDGLWGFEWSRAEEAWIDGLVVEYLQTTDQSGPIHWAPSDFNQDIQTKLPNEARGADDYYNNYFYCGYAHHGQAIGSPMLKSPAYNADGYLRFSDSRVRAWHIGLAGHTRPGRRHQMGYKLLASYRNAYGTPFLPANHIQHAFNFLFEYFYEPSDHWDLSVTYAADRGSLYGDNTAVGLKATYYLYVAQ